MQPPPSPRSHRAGSPLLAARALVGVLVVGVLVGWVFFAGGDDTTDDDPTTPAADGTTTTAPGDGTGDTTDGTADDGTDGTTDGSGPGDDAAGTSTTLPSAPLQGVALEPIVTVSQPTMITAPEGDGRLFVAERGGTVKVIQPDGTITTFLDITDRVLAGGIEQGLLGLAFHPDYETNGRFFVYFTDRPDANRQVSEFAVSATDPNAADPATEKVLYERRQPDEATDIRHYAGMLKFGPDGYLYITSGDGASARTQPQDPNTFFGSMLRLDVDAGDPYGIPADNPFADGVDGAPEVWAFGLRNAWRFDIDPPTGKIVIGDVGQGDVEEINLVDIGSGGYNFGWANMEGSRCFFEAGCDPANYTMPVVEYSHEEGCSVTGGVVYRGAAIPELDGTYFYGDWCRGWIKSFEIEGDGITNERDWTDELGAQEQLNVFGEDGFGEIIIGRMSGELLKLVPVR
ncbi:MAG: PQQ-dependent sugar dehydrogenase [Acidimicrobiia bacterium]